MATTDREQIERELDAHYAEQARAIQQLRQDIAATRAEVAAHIERLRAEIGRGQ